MNREKYNQAVNRAGYQKRYLAAQLGLSPAGLISKVSGRTRFKESEIDKLKYLLRLSDAEAYEIFYNG